MLYNFAIYLWFVATCVNLLFSLRNIKLLNDYQKQLEAERAKLAYIENLVEALRKFIEDQSRATRALQ